MPMSIKVKDPNTGELVDGKVVKVVKAEEPFMYITLEDGYEITMRASVAKVVRLIGQKDDQGNPKYSIALNNTITIAPSS